MSSRVPYGSTPVKPRGFGSSPRFCGDAILINPAGSTRRVGVESITSGGLRRRKCVPHLGEAIAAAFSADIAATAHGRFQTAGQRPQIQLSRHDASSPTTESRGLTTFIIDATALAGDDRGERWNPRGGARWAVRTKLVAAGLSYLILAKHSFMCSSSERTCASMVFCNASVPLLDNSAEAFLSRFCFQSRIACLVALWASDVALRYAFMQASAVEQV